MAFIITRMLNCLFKEHGPIGIKTEPVAPNADKGIYKKGFVSCG